MTKLNRGIENIGFAECIQDHLAARVHIHIAVTVYLHSWQNSHWKRK